MESKLDKLLKGIYKKWKSGHAQAQGSHPDEETLACFFENKLPKEENEHIKAHLVTCDNCAEAAAGYVRLQTITEETKVPGELLAFAKELVKKTESTSVLEIILRLSKDALEIINITGDVLLGNELVPAPVLRSRRVKDFKDEVTILKDFKDIRVEIKIENKAGEAFNLKIMARHKQSQQLIKDLRVALLKGDLELESCLSESGLVNFEHVLLGKYTVEISDISNKLASILIDIKI